MAISVDCPNCSKTLKAKDAAAGKTAKCPGCGEPIRIPEISEVYDAEDEFGGSGDAEADLPMSSGTDQKPCPMCGEMIAAAAKKCRYCGEIFDAALKRSSGRKKSSRSRGNRYPIADLGKRFLGAMAEGLVGVLLMAPGIVCILAANPDAPQPDETLIMLGVIGMLLGFLLLIGLQIYLLATRSQSIGKYLVNTQIMDYETDEPAGFVKSFLLRSVVNGFIGAIPWIGSCYGLIDILFIFGEEHRCIHVQIAGTYVADIS